MIKSPFLRSALAVCLAANLLRPAQAGPINLNAAPSPAAPGVPGGFVPTPEVLSGLNLGADSGPALTRLMGLTDFSSPAAAPNLPEGAPAPTPTEPLGRIREDLSDLTQRTLRQADWLLSSLARTDPASRPASELRRAEELSQRLADLRAVAAAIPGMDEAAQARLASYQDALDAAPNRLNEALLAKLRAPAFDGSKGGQERTPVAADAAPAPRRAALSRAAASARVEPFHIPDLVVPSRVDTVEFGGERFPVFAVPTHSDIPDMLARFVGLSQLTLSGFYEFGLPNLAEAIVAASKQGRPFLGVGDYSNLFPHKLSQANHGARHEERTAALQTLVDNIGPNLQLSVLKGLGSIGINHNKFLIGKDKSGKEVLLTGSFNFTPTSQERHFEIVTWTDDPRRIALFKAYHKWMWSIARVFNEDLQPEDPDINGSPIPRDSSPSVEYNGKKFPLVTFSPQGGTLEWLIEATKVVQDAMYVVMFSFFPPRALEDQISEALKNGRHLRILADSGQAHNASALTRLMRLGAEIRLIAGPDEAPYNPKNRHQFPSKQHMKLFFFDSSFLEGYGSTNISGNAFGHNFENASYWTGVMVQMLLEYAESMWPLGYAPSQTELERIVGGNRRQQIDEQRAIPWSAGHRMTPNSALIATP